MGVFGLEAAADYVSSPNGDLSIVLIPIGRVAVLR